MGVTASTLDSWFLVGIDADELVQTLQMQVKRKDAADTDTQADQTEKPKDETGAAIGDSELGLETDEYTLKRVTLTQKRDHWTLEQKRRLVGVTAFAPDTGAYTSAFSFVTGPTTQGSWATGTMRFRCTKDFLRVTDERVGEYEQTQVWEYFGKWKNIKPSDMGQE